MLANIRADDKNCIRYSIGVRSDCTLATVRSLCRSLSAVSSITEYIFWSSLQPAWGHKWRYYRAIEWWKLIFGISRCEQWARNGPDEGRTLTDGHLHTSIPAYEYRRNTAYKRTQMWTQTHVMLHTFSICTKPSANRKKMAVVCMLRNERSIEEVKVKELRVSRRRRNTGNYANNNTIFGCRFGFWCANWIESTTDIPNFGQWHKILPPLGIY